MADLKLSRCRCPECKDGPTEECLLVGVDSYLLVSKRHRSPANVAKIAKHDREQEREAAVRDLIATKEAARNRYAKAAGASSAYEIAAIMEELGREVLGSAAISKSRCELVAVGADADKALYQLYAARQAQESRAARRR